jgi:hypothetical protein
LHRTVGGNREVSRSQSPPPTRLCTRRSGGERTSIRVWCSHVGAAPSYGNQVRTQDRLLTAPRTPRRKKSKKSARRGSLSLDTWGPHTCSAAFYPLGLGTSPLRTRSSSTATIWPNESYTTPSFCCCRIPLRTSSSIAADTSLGLQPSWDATARCTPGCQGCAGKKSLTCRTSASGGAGLDCLGLDSADAGRQRPTTFGSAMPYRVATTVQHFCTKLAL